MKRSARLIEQLLGQKNGEQDFQGSVTSVSTEDENITRLATRYAQAFSSAFSKKQFIVLCSVPVPLAQVINLGAWMAGFPVAYLDPAFSKSQLDHALSQLGASLNIGYPNCLSSPEEKFYWLTPGSDSEGNDNLSDWLQQNSSKAHLTPHNWQDDECATVIFTSGTTGMPKGVCHSIGNLTRSAQLFIQQFAIDSQDRLLNLAPLHTMSGLRTSIFVPLLVDCQLIENPSGTKLEDILNTIQHSRPTIIVSGPMFIRQISMLADKLDEELRSIRVLLSTGSKLDRRSRVLIWEKQRIPVLDYYGLTETAGLIIGEKVDYYNPELTSIGKACSGITVDLIEMEGISDPSGRMGQLRIYSPNLFLGYLGQPLVRMLYFDTGDLAFRDSDGNFHLKGRLDHGVKGVSTQWIFPEAVEKVLLERPDITDALVLSGHDKYDRGILHAKVVLAFSDTVNDGWINTLKLDIGKKLGPDYHFTEIKIVRAISRTVLGKLSSDKAD